MCFNQHMTAVHLVITYSYRRVLRVGSASGDPLLSHPCPSSEFLFILLVPEAVYPALPGAPFRPRELISPSFKLLEGLVCISSVVEDRLCATCSFCSKYLSPILNRESLKGKDCILFIFINTLLA